jgi:CheY-like chemotaxis protein
MRSDEDLRDVPVVILSGVHRESRFHFSPETDGEFLPVERFLEKPVDPGVLLRTVADLLERRAEEGGEDA